MNNYRFCIYDTKKDSDNLMKNIKMMLAVVSLVDIKENLMTKMYSAEAKWKAE